ncbi:MAG: vWA domain-containing protein [Bacillota bacterium]|jgi:magnesium chelatase subunit D
MTVFPHGSTLRQRSALSRLSRILSDGLAARVGETSVVSTKVHMQDAAIPQDVVALCHSDAGQVFYNRAKKGEVIHIDVFHSPGEINPKSVARALISGLSGLRFDTYSDLSRLAPFCLSSLETLFPYVDIQTGGGGGRLDGDLCYGQEKGVRQAHLTHVHLSALNTPEMVASIFTIIASVEAAIENEGLQLRKIRKVRVSQGGSPADISDYKATSDSLLRTLPNSCKEASVYRKEALARQAARDVGSAADTLRILEALAKGLRAGEFSRLKPDTDKSSDEIRQGLTRSRLARFDGQKYTLTEEGGLALAFLREHSHEIEAYLRRLLWALPSRNIPSGQRRGKKTEAGQSRGRCVTGPKQPGEHASEVSLPESVIVHSVRTLGAPGPFCPEDLRYSYVRTKSQVPVILLMDASASMAGRRIAAAKELARHLVVTGKDKVSVVIFQDSEVRTVCDFTKNPRKLEEGLKNIQAMGLTPLAKGLERALELSYRCARKPIVLCVTDGIPTVPSRSMSPTDDAVEAARSLDRRGIRLGCIGLEPNQSFLRQMVAAAKGALYIVDELEASTLAAIARRERA